MAAACGQQRGYTCTYSDCGRQFGTDLELMGHIRQQHIQQQPPQLQQPQVQQPSPLPRAQSAKSPRVNSGSRQQAQKQPSNGVAKTPPVGNHPSAFTAPQPQQMMNPLMAGGIQGMQGMAGTIPPGLLAAASAGQLPPWMNAMMPWGMAQAGAGSNGPIPGSAQPPPSMPLPPSATVSGVMGPTTATPKPVSSHSNSAQSSAKHSPKTGNGSGSAQKAAPAQANG